MAHLKTAGTARMNRDSLPKHLGVKLYSGQKAEPGYIIVRQKGTKVRPGSGVKMGDDYTLYSVRRGQVWFFTKQNKKVVSVV